MLSKRVPEIEIIEDASIDMPGAFRLLIDRLLEHLLLLQRQVEEIEAQIRAIERTMRVAAWRRCQVSAH